MSLLAFAIAATVLAVTPGPGIAYVVARTVAGGRPEGLASCLGTGIGGMLHVLAAALGLSILVAQSAAAFTVVKYLGAAYLAYLGIRLLLRQDHALAVERVASQGARRALFEGILVEVLNVKTALFFLAFLPQFIDGGAPHKGWAFAALGAVFAFNGTIVNVAFAALVARMRRTLGASGAAGRWVSRGVGALFIALGVRLAWFDSR